MTLDQLLKPHNQQQKPPPQQPQHLTTTTITTKNPTTKPPAIQTKPPQKAPKETCHNQPCYHLPEGYTIGQCQPTNLYIPVDLAKQQKLCTNKNTAYHHKHHPHKPQPTNNSRKGVNKK
jgi:hypothetical protein